MEKPNNNICKKEKHIGFEIRRLSNMIKREMDNFQSTNELFEGVSGINSWIIRYLADNSEKAVYQKDIEQRFSLRRSTVSKDIALMEQKGLIVKTNVREDARLKKLVLTEKAWEVHKSTIKNIDTIERKMKTGICDDEYTVFMNVIDKIKSNLGEVSEEKQI